MTQHPSVENLVHFLSHNLETENLLNVKRSCAYLQKIGFEFHKTVGKYVALSFEDVGMLPTPVNLFDGLLRNDESSWTALIKCYVHLRKFRQALVLYDKMCDLYLQPDRYTFIALIKSSAEVKEIKSGCKLHLQAVQKGWTESDLFVGNAFVDMYAKCGQLAAALDVFRRLPVRDLVSWNALISGFTKSNQRHTVLNFVEEMRLEGFLPDPTTFVCTLNACGLDNIKARGFEFHAEIVKKGLLEISNILGNALISMYSRCNMLLEAQNVFDRLLLKDVVPWNALISGYAAQGYGKDALRCVKEMQLAEISPNAVSFVCALKACSSAEEMDAAQTLHAEICRKGLLMENVYVGNAVIGFYSQSGFLTQAREVLDSLPVRNVVSWNTMIAGYASFGLGEDALDCLAQMSLDGLSPSCATYICSLKACGNVGAILKGIGIHAEIVRTRMLGSLTLPKGVDKEVPAVQNALVDMYSKCGFMEKAQEVFNKFQVHDLVLWTTLIAGYASLDWGDKAIECLKQLRLEGFSPSSITYVCSLDACGCVAAASEGKRLHAEISVSSLLHSNICIGNALVHMYAECGLLMDALQVFNNLPVRDEVSWTAIISAYIEHELAEEAFELLERMQHDGFSPNPVTYSCLLKACAATGATGIGRNLHHELASKGFLEKNSLVSNILMDMYVKCSLLPGAQDLFYELPFRDVISWTVLIGGFVKMGESFGALCLFDAMSMEGQIPDLIVFINILMACGQLCAVDLGHQYFYLMSNKYGLKPSLEHYTCMADLLSHSGYLIDALAMVGNSGFHPDLVLVHMILYACKRLGNKEIGRRAFDQVSHLDEDFLRTSHFTS